MAAKRVLLVGWDAADWKVMRPLMDAGRMPHVRRLVENGASGQIATLHPPLSPMLWTSIATGKRPFKHGVHGFSEPTPDGRGVQPVTNLSRTSKALWNILQQNARRSVVIGWWPSHPAEPIDGVMVSDHFHRAGGPLDQGWPLLPHAVHPPELAQTLAGLRVHPDQLTPELVTPFIPLAREIDQDQDKRLAMFLRTLAECMSVHAAAEWLIENQSWDFFAVYYDAIDHFCHGFMKYHPPRQSWIAEQDFDLYRNVVAAAYEMHDRMLGALLAKAGPEATVLLMSDHGFHPDHLRPASIPDIPAGPAVEHRDFGVLALGGPGIRNGEVLHGASLLDVAPTVLTLFGLPVGEDMDGKVLAPAFATPPPIEYLPSWDAVPGADGRHPVRTRLDPVAAREALEQMIALGYIERPDENREMAVAKTIRDLRFNLAEAYQDGGRHQEAYEIFTELCAADPDEQRFAVGLFVSCQALGRMREMRRIVDDLDGRRRALYEEAETKLAEVRGDPATEEERRQFAQWRNLARYQPFVADYLKSQVLTAEKRYAEALTALQGVIDAQAAGPERLPQIADLYLHLGRWRDARQVFEQALANDPDDAQAHLGLCRIALRRRNYDEAAHAALDALQRVHHSPTAHFLLGQALTGLRKYPRAAGAFRAAISFNPNFPEAHDRLAAILENHLEDAPSAREHRRLARRMRSRRMPRPLPERDTPAVDQVASLAVPAAEMPPLAESLVVVTGLPRSGTSLLMQMLVAGGMNVLSDGRREADEDNPRGYFELEAVKSLLKDSTFLREERGKAIKIVAPLLRALPPGLPCRVILCERDLEEILDSQERMLARRCREVPAATPERRRMLADEFARSIGRVKAMLPQRPLTQLLTVEYRRAVSDPLATAEEISRFLGGGFDVKQMAAAIDPALHRSRTARALPA
ncbi:MAG TPA: alkaline phosphatase family protein [Bryobacteraceae bacterium]